MRGRQFIPSFHDPNVLGELFELRLGSAGLRLGGEADADLEDGVGTLDVGGGEAFVDERGRERLGGLLVDR